MKNRRAAARFRASDDRIWIGRWVDPSRFELQAARVENISSGGARIVTPSLLIEGQPIWLRPENPTCQECIEATVLEVQRDGKGIFSARLEFSASCRDEIMRAVLGSIPAPHFRLLSREGQDAREFASCRKLTRRH